MIIWHNISVITIFAGQIFPSPGKNVRQIIRMMVGQRKALDSFLSIKLPSRFPLFFAARMAACGTECIVLAHLSKENNTPQLAYDAVDRALRAGGARVRLYVAPRDELSPAYETEGTPCRR